MTSPADQQTAGIAIAALSLTQIAFEGLLRSGLISREDAERRLKEAIAANKLGGGPGNRIAAAALEEILKNSAKWKPATRQ
jgi:hypothetical protein